MQSLYFLWDSDSELRAVDSSPKTWSLSTAPGQNQTPTPGRNVCVLLKDDLRENERCTIVYNGVQTKF